MMALSRAKNPSLRKRAAPTPRAPPALNGRCSYCVFVCLVCMYTHIYILCVYVYVHVYVYLCVYVFFLYVYVYICTYMLRPN